MQKLLEAHPLSREEWGKGIFANAGPGREFITGTW